MGPQTPRNPADEWRVDCYDYYGTTISFVTNPTTNTARQPARRLVSLRKKLRSAFGIAEQVVAMAIVATVLVASVAGLLQSNRQAAVYRALTAARAVVERNIENALNVTYNSTATPAILATTAAGGVVYDDEGDGDNLVDIVVQDSTGTNKLIKGTLTRTVVAEANPQSASIIRITFSVTFTMRGRNYTTAMTTLRAIDDF